MALVGNLKDLKLPSLIQLNCMERNTAKLTIENEGKYGFMYFDKGQIVHAEFDPDIGEKAVYRLLTLYMGHFKVESGIRPPVKSINTSWNNLLLEGLHQLDAKEEDQEHKYDHLFERMLTVRGVSSVLLINKEGDIIAGSSGNKGNDNFLFALTMLEAEKFGETLNIEKPEFVSIATSPNRYVITTYNQFYIILELSIKIKLDVVMPFIKQALG